jgi:hypothetical protein
MTRRKKMKNRFRVALAATGLALFSGVASAQIKEFKPRTLQVPPSLDKVQMVSFVSEPAQIAPGATQVVLRVTVKNVTDSNLATGYVLNGLKVKIFRTKPLPEILEMETTVNNLAVGVPQSVGAPVNIGPGEREYTAKVDPDNTLKEPTPQQRANNEMRLKLTIPQVSGQQAPPAGSTPPKETQLLDYDKAKRSGAQFAASLEGPSTCLVDQKDANDASLSDRSGRPASGVWFRLFCSFTVTGARTNPEAFTNFHLKNGWKVKSYDVVGIRKVGDSEDWQWTKTPSIGSDDPSSKLHMWADANRSIELFVKVEIEGPAGTNPYQ